MNEGTRSGKSTIRLLGISAERPTNGLYLFTLHTHFQGKIQKRIRNVTDNKDKLNYTINVLIIRAVYGPIEEIMELEKTLGTRLLLAVMLHTGTKNKM
jgi:hypothetical protein